MVQEEQLVFEMLLQPGQETYVHFGPARKPHEPFGRATFLNVPPGFILGRMSEWFSNTYRQLWMFDAWSTEGLRNQEKAMTFSPDPISQSDTQRTCAFIRTYYNSFSEPNTIISVFFPTADIDHTGLSSAERWGATYNRVVRDANQEFMLRMRFPKGVSEDELIDALKRDEGLSGAGTFDVTFHVRTRLGSPRGGLKRE